MPDILHRVGIAASPEQVFHALTSVEGIRGWWSSVAECDASEGGSFRFRSNQFTVLQADPALCAGAFPGLPTTG